MRIGGIFVHSGSFKTDVTSPPPLFQIAMRPAFISASPMVSTPPHPRVIRKICPRGTFVSGEIVMIACQTRPAVRQRPARRSDP